MFRYGKIPTINKSTRVRTNTASAIDHTTSKVIIDTDFKTGIFKSCISDHFAIMLNIQKMCNKSEQHIRKRTFSENF